MIDFNRNNVSNNVDIFITALKKQGEDMLVNNMMMGASVYILLSILLLYGRHLFRPDNPDTYTVTYNGNGNTGGGVPTDTREYTPGDTVIIKENIGNLTRTGYIFTGWNTEQDGSGVRLDPGNTFLMEESNVILYAHWV